MIIVDARASCDVFGRGNLLSTSHKHILSSSTSRGRCQARADLCDPILCITAMGFDLTLPFDAVR